MTPFEDGALFVGMSESGGDGLDVLLGSVSADGQVRLDVRAGWSGDEIGHGVVPLPGGGFLVTGYGARSPSGSNDVLFVFLDEHAQEVDRITIQGPDDERAMMTAVSSGGLLGTVGYAQRDGDWDITLWEGTPDRPASRVWTHVMPGVGRGVMAIPTADGSWIITGTLEIGADPGQLVVLKIARVERTYEYDAWGKLSSRAAAAATWCATRSAATSPCCDLSDRDAPSCPWQRPRAF